MNTPGLPPLRTLVPAQGAAFLATVAIGVCLILNSQTAAGGTWYQYATLFMNGTRLYKDLHLPLQPFFVYDTVFWRLILGNYWTSSFIEAIFHQVLLSFSIFLLVEQSAWPRIERAIVYIGAFCVSISLEFYQFDDYHVIPDTIAVYATVVVLTLIRAEFAIWGVVLRAGLLGILAGISFTTRANDGLFLLAALAVLASVIKSHRLLYVSALTSAFVVTTAISVLATGDTWRDYFQSTFQAAAPIKGGLAQLALAPLLLVLRLRSFLFSFTSAICWALFGLLFVGTLLVIRIIDDHRLSRAFRLASVVAGSLTFLVTVWLVERVNPDFFVSRIGPAIMIALLAAGVDAIAVIVGVVPNASKLRALSLIPCSQLASFSLSSAGHIEGLYAPVGLMIALAPIIYPAPLLTQRLPRLACLMGCSLLCVSTVLCKYLEPTWWIHYRAKPEFTGRGLIRHKLYGYMYTDLQMDRFFVDICEEIRSHSAATTSLLSTPYSYANYYCGINAWHGYVQTWYDTTSSSTIKEMVAALGANPPDWILYERQAGVIRSHEIYYNHGRPLAYRAVDALLMARLASGKWTLVLSRRWGRDDTWMLIRTTPSARATTPAVHTPRVPTAA